MSAHTKGPWVVEAGGPRLVNTHACVISAGDGLGPVAYSTREYARLISAAPDCFDVIQGIEFALINGVSAAAILDENSPLRDALRAAIAKAVQS